MWHFGPMKFIVQALTLVLLVPSTSSYACTAFCLSNSKQVVVGKSYDWFFGHGHGAVFVNPRGLARTALILDRAPNPARWTSRYGSVTLTQFGRGLPISGMNEKGLVVELLQLPEANYNSSQHDKPYVNESQWAQVQLDTFESVAEVLAHVADLRIERAYTGIHYFVADASGKSATVEFLNGQAVVHAGETLPAAVLANGPYAADLEYSRWPTSTAWTKLQGRRSEIRFQTAARMVGLDKQIADQSLPDLGWKILRAVRLNGFASDAAGEPSQWNIIHDLTARTISFRTRGAKTIKTLALDRLDFSKGAAELMGDMNQPAAGDFTPHLHPYDPARNEALVRRNTLLFTLSGQRAKIKPAVEFGRVSPSPAASE